MIFNYRDERKKENRRERNRRYRERVKERKKAQLEQTENMQQESEEQNLDLDFLTNADVAKVPNSDVYRETNSNPIEFIDYNNYEHYNDANIDDEENADPPNFDCMVQFNHEKNIRPAGVSIHDNSNELHVTTSHMEIKIKNVLEVVVGNSDVGDLCATHIVLRDGREIVMVVVYVSPNQKIPEIIKFLHRFLLVYTRSGSRILLKNNDKLPLILAGDFNTNFSNNEALPLVKFLEREFQLVLSNHARESTMMLGMSINAVFSRYLDNFNSDTFMTYFSYLQPVVNFGESDVSKEEITDELSD